MLTTALEWPFWVLFGLFAVAQVTFLALLLARIATSERARAAIP